MTFQTAYSEKVQQRTVNTLPSRTKQSMSENLDVNNIIKRYKKTGILQRATDFEGIYGDFTTYDLREAIEKVRDAEKLFMEVPSKIRNQFENNAAAFIDFATNPANRQQMVDWNMADPLPVEAAPAEPAVSGE